MHSFSFVGWIGKKRAGGGRHRRELPLICCAVSHCAIMIKNYIINSIQIKAPVSSNCRKADFAMSGTVSALFRQKIEKSFEMGIDNRLAVRL
jgi:hypothetical protein